MKVILYTAWMLLFDPSLGFEGPVEVAAWLDPVTGKPEYYDAESCNAAITGHVFKLEDYDGKAVFLYCQRDLEIDNE